jgi:hypothetical protein
MATIPHPAGGGRQQPNPADYTITAARIANEDGNAAVLQTEEAGAVLASEADTPALFEKFQAWAQEPGNSAEPYTPPSSVPQTITKLQAILAIKAFDQANNTDLMGSINDWIANNESEELKLRWEYATEIDRDSPLIALAKSALDLSDELLDALFSAAAQL